MTGISAFRLNGQPGSRTRSVLWPCCSLKSLLTEFGLPGVGCKTSTVLVELFLATVICPKQGCGINNLALLPERKKETRGGLGWHGENIRQVENVTSKHSIVWSKCGALLKGNLGPSTQSQEPWDQLYLQILLFSLLC